MVQRIWFPRVTNRWTPVIRGLITIGIEVSGTIFPLYHNKFTNPNSTYTDKQTAQGSAYSDKHSARNNTYQDKY